MTTTHLTMAGHLALAGDARVAAGHQGMYGHQSASWTMGAIAEPATKFVVLDRKNRPTRHLSELSP